MFELFLSNPAEKDLKKLDGKLRARIEELFDKLTATPLPARDYDLKKLKGEADTYRIRLSNYRIVYNVYWHENKIRILKIERRSETTYD